MPAAWGVTQGGLMPSDVYTYARWLVANSWSESLGLGTLILAGRVAATALGAGLAWLLGMLPSTFFALADAGAGPQEVKDPGPLLSYALA